MKKILLFIIIGIFLTSTSQAKHNTFYYDLNVWLKWEIQGSNNFYKFQSNLREDKEVTKEIKNTKKTGLISYLLFEEDKIVIDESALPVFIKNNNGLLGSNSVGKSLVSYMTGHAICEGYIDSVDIKLDDWSVLKGTLYEGQKLIDLLNMKAGDQKFIGSRNYHTDNILGKIKDIKINVNTIPLVDLMKLDLIQNAKKSSSVYNYNALVTNIVMNYTIYKTGEDWEKLLHKVFNEHVKVKDNVYFLRTVKQMNEYYKGKELGRYTFYATRYDYLRIAKRMMDDWNNDTCAGKYLKTIYEQRINKNKKSYNGDRHGQFSASQYTRKYGGQFHFDFVGMIKRKILAMDGFAGQQILIDFEKERIIVVNTIDQHYNWKKIVLKKLKQK